MVARMADDRKLLYSERKRLAETGNLGSLDDDASAALRGALGTYYTHAPHAKVKTKFAAALEYEFALRFGGKFSLAWINKASADALNDWIELVVQFGEATYYYKERKYFGGRSTFEQESAVPLRKVQVDLNRLFDIHRYGFRLTNGEIHKISSPMLEFEIMSPALLTIQKPGWDVVDRQYREALRHQRDSAEGPDALIAANSAVESALKAMGFKGNSLDDLIKKFRNSKRATGFPVKVLDNLHELTNQLMAWRSSGGKAHGVAMGTPPPPAALVALAIHWAGALLVFLAELPEESP
jgi:hypothetical protein